MFILSIIAPDSYPVGMGIFGSMEQAIKSAHMSSEMIQWEKDTEHYKHGLMFVKGEWRQFSIVECGLCLQAQSVFRN